MRAGLVVDLDGDGAAVEAADDVGQQLGVAEHRGAVGLAR